MVRDFLFVLLASAVASGCYTAQVLDRDAAGKHGEHFVKLECGETEQCMELARRTCEGDFEVESNDTTSSGFGHAPPGTAHIMLVRCATTPTGAAPASAKAGH